MKKLLYIFVAVLWSLNIFSQVSISTNWELSDSLSTLPLTIGTSNGARGMAFGDLGSGERMFVVSRSADMGNKVQIYNGADGVYVGALDMTGVDGGTFIMNDAGMTEDGKLLMGNLGNPLRIYKWDSETGAPIKVIDWATTSSRRYGDKITVTGNYSLGTARIYVLPNASLTGYKLQYFEMEQVDGVWQFKQTPTEMNTSLTISGYPAVDVRSDGGFYLKTGGGNITQYDNAGVLFGAASVTAVVPAGSSTVRFIKTVGDYDYLAYVRYYGSSTAVSSAKAAANRVEIVRVPVATGLADAQFVASTASLGKNSNLNGAAGLVVKLLSDNLLEVYVLNTNNGIAKYTMSGLFTTNLSATHVEKIEIKRSDDEIIVGGEMPVSINLYNVSGQIVRCVNKDNHVFVRDLKGLYLVKLCLSDNSSVTTKIVL